MKTLLVAASLIFLTATVCFAQTGKKLVSSEQLFPKAQQRQMGLYKHTAKEKEALRAHVEGLLIQVASSAHSTASAGSKASGATVYPRVGGGHWIQKNIDSGTYMTLEDGSLWQFDPLDKIDAMLWLPVTEITVTESSSGSPGYDYLLINTDDGEKAHAKYIGQK